MKVLLLQDVEKLGTEGEIVTIRDGYGRNFLIPQGLARLATPGVVKSWQEERRQAARKLMQAKEEAQRLAAQLEGQEIIIRAKVGAENRIFGSVTAQQIALELATRGFQIDRRRIDLEDIRMLGVYTAHLKLHAEVHTELKVRVESDEAPAETTAEAETEA
jgi:large subunit ribosomal protein L9